jgi:zinc D-Ala-D-Ala dipeptidase
MLTSILTRNCYKYFFYSISVLTITSCSKSLNLYSGKNVPSSEHHTNELPQENLILLSNIDATIIQNLRYCSPNNFTGNAIPTYPEHAKCILQAAYALKKAHDDFKEKGYNLVVYDAYRPQEAVDHFYVWSQSNNDEKKHLYYPYIEKGELFKKGYISRKSSHTTGNTFDISIITLDKPLSHNNDEALNFPRRLNNGETIPFIDDHTVDMGSSFDLFHEASHVNTPLITETQQANRKLLQETMEKHGFKVYEKEWWHFSLIQ